MLIVSCNKDKKTPDSGEVTEFDQLAYLQSSLVKVDSEGKFAGRVAGIPVWPEDTSRVAIAADDMDAAKVAFKALFSSDVKFEEKGDKISATLTHNQGSVTLEPYGEENAVARMSFNNVDIKFVSSVLFIPESKWPENNAGGVSPHEVGDLVNMGTVSDGDKNWVCLRAASPTEYGILMYISSGSVKYFSDKYASEGEAKTVCHLFRNNWDAMSAAAKKAGFTINRNDEFWVNMKTWQGYPKTISVPDGRIDWHESVFKTPKYRYMQTMSFGMMY